MRSSLVQAGSLGCAALWALLVSIACRSTDQPHVPVAETPIFLRSTTPADSAEFVGLDLIDLSMAFSEEFDLTVGTVRLAPPPLASGSMEQTGRIWTWHDLQLGDGALAYTLLIDAPRMVQPYLLHFFTDETEVLGGRMGGCIEIGSSRFDPLETVVFALDLNDLEEIPQELPDVAALPPVSFAVIRPLGSLCDAYYWFQFLPLDRHYVTFAIIDTSGDGRYDIRDDWWAEGGGVPGVFLAPTRLDLELRRPYSGES